MKRRERVINLEAGWIKDGHAEGKFAMTRYSGGPESLQRE
jgi:hypothetical protein